MLRIYASHGRVYCHSSFLVYQASLLSQTIPFVGSVTRRHVRSAHSTATNNATFDPNRTRNIGIIAHIDAGKTTTTERMLYYSGHTRRIGDVDDGSTVTDFLPAERARGITIQSAAITFDWPATTMLGSESSNSSQRSSVQHHINLIDTPGHADFTFEVRRSLRILDGAICILDGVAGVEAQTEQVWLQAKEWKIPRIAYVNKLDRDGAAFGRTVREIGARLRGWPALCQIPWFKGGKGQFCGIADVITLQGLKYNLGGDGKDYQRFSLPQLRKLEPELADELQKARIALIEVLSEHDDSLVEDFLDADEDHLALSPLQVLRSLRRILLQENCQIIPVFAGASFRNIGVQPLLDAVNNLLPGPNERPSAEVSIGSTNGTLEELRNGDLISQATNNLTKKQRKGVAQTALAVRSSLSGCALAFKVVNDPRKGMLVYIRVYHGTIRRNDNLFNTNLQVSEKATNLLRMYASDSVQVDSIEAGQIGVIAGSKYARTGDTLISCEGSKTAPTEPLNQLQLRPIYVPPPVFFASIEPNSLREERDMHDKLALLIREDPSLHVTQDEDTGQTLLSGMGELHLEIARDRLVNDLKANARMGEIAIGYREAINTKSSLVTKIFERDRGDGKGRAGCEVEVMPWDGNEEMDREHFAHYQDGNAVVIKVSASSAQQVPDDAEEFSIPSHLTLGEIRLALINGVLAALSRSPCYRYPLQGTRVVVNLKPTEHLFGTDTTTSAVAAAARLATTAAVKESTSNVTSSLMEPVMSVNISVDDSTLGNVIQDISSTRGGHVISLGDEEGVQSNNDQALKRIDVGRIYAPRDPFESNSMDQVTEGQSVNLPRSIQAKVPLKEMVGYLKHLRSMTGGRGTFVMNVDRFEKMTGQREKSVLAEIRGY